MLERRSISDIPEEGIPFAAVIELATRNGGAAAPSRISNRYTVVTRGERRITVGGCPPSAVVPKDIACNMLRELGLLAE